MVILPLETTGGTYYVTIDAAFLRTLAQHGLKIVPLGKTCMSSDIPSRKSVSREQRRALLSQETSRRNKLALLATYLSEGLPVEWAWKGEPYESRLQVRFEGGEWQTCKSYDEDIRPFLLGRDE